MTQIRLKKIRVENQTTPLGLDVENPRFSWQYVTSLDAVFQVAYQIFVFMDEELIWESQKNESSQMNHIFYAGKPLKAMTRYEIIVKSWDNYGNCVQGSSHWETGRFNIKWRAQWIEPNQKDTETFILENAMEIDPHIETDYELFNPVHYIRIPFKIPQDKKVKSARVYATAHGVYDLEVNGQALKEHFLAPEITAYDALLQYQVYDITDQVNPDENMMGIMLGDGWWCGRVGLTGESCQFGNRKAVLLEGVINYEDGTQMILTPEHAVSTTGPIHYSDIFVGECYDARQELLGWSLTEFDDANWEKVSVKAFDYDNIVGQYGPGITTYKTFKPKEIIKTPLGETVLNLGQNIAGYIEFELDTRAGYEISFEHSEVLDKRGNFINNILGVHKDQKDTYTTRDGFQTYHPKFTYHGFQYVKITGWPGDINVGQFTAHVLTSEMEELGTFETSDPKINQLQSNIYWSQIANTISIPTDCPQRERAGWTGDAMVFSPTMCFNRDAQSFLTRWLKNCRIEQEKFGVIPMIVPYFKGYQTMGKAFGSDTSCGWGDAIVVLPWNLYCIYGDLRVLEENYMAMKKWMSYIENDAKAGQPEGYDAFSEKRKNRQVYLWNTGFHFGDWLVPSMVMDNPDGSAMIETAFKTKDIVAPAYFAFTSQIMIEVSQKLGKNDDQAYYKKLNRNIRDAFIEEYVHEDGTLDCDFQGIYVICLKIGLVTEAVKPKMVAHLRQMIVDNGYRLDTGFLSIHFLMDVLCENGCRDLAYRLLFQESCPSWLYEVNKGATTMWESWSAISTSGEVSSYSYNHYAFGCIGDWMYREIGGLQAIEPGYKHFRIKPAFDCGLSSASVSHETPYGQAAVKWIKKGNQITLNATVPPNTTAEISINEKLERIQSGRHDFIFTV